MKKNKNEEYITKAVVELYIREFVKSIEEELRKTELNLAEQIRDLRKDYYELEDRLDFVQDTLGLYPPYNRDNV